MRYERWEIRDEILEMIDERSEIRDEGWKMKDVRWDEMRDESCEIRDKSLKFLRFVPSGWKYIGMMKFEFVAKSVKICRTNDISKVVDIWWQRYMDWKSSD